MLDGDTGYAPVWPAQTSWKGDHFPHRRHRLSRQFSGAGARPKPGTCQVRSEQPGLAGRQRKALYVLEARSSVASLASGSLPPTHSCFNVFHGYSINVGYRKRVNHRR
eukprot:scaffold58903_cov57-Phaeocystis_antarctica.AAC.1